MLVDIETGFVDQRVSVPQSQFEDHQPPDGKRMVVPADGIIPVGRIRLDMRKVRQAITQVGCIAEVQSSWRPKALPERHCLDIARADAIAALDASAARRIDALRGPLATLHAEKRRQAEAGGGPLVAGETDRRAILANAAAEDEAVAAIERERRALKARLRAARTEDEIKAILADN